MTTPYIKTGMAWLRESRTPGELELKRQVITLLTKVLTAQRQASEALDLAEGWRRRALEAERRGPTPLRESQGRVRVLS
jgi:hypothetical protein